MKCNRNNAGANAAERYTQPIAGLWQPLDLSAARRVRRSGRNDLKGEAVRIGRLVDNDVRVGRAVPGQREGMCDRLLSRDRAIAEVPQKGERRDASARCR